MISSKEVRQKSNSWLGALRRAALKDGLAWTDPHISFRGEGEIVLEWWSDPRDVTVYITSDSVQFVKSWGVSVSKEMEDGILERPEDSLELFKWLFSSPS